MRFDEIVAKALMWALIGGQTEFVALLLPEVRMLCVDEHPRWSVGCYFLTKLASRWRACPCFFIETPRKQTFGKVAKLK